MNRKVKRSLKILSIILLFLIAADFVCTRFVPFYGAYRGLFFIALSFDLGALLIISAIFLIKEVFIFFPLLVGAVFLIRMFAPKEVSAILSPLTMTIGVIYYLFFVW